MSNFLEGESFRSGLVRIFSLVSPGQSCKHGCLGFHGQPGCGWQKRVCWAKTELLPPLQSLWLNGAHSVLSNFSEVSTAHIDYKENTIYTFNNRSIFLNLKNTYWLLFARHRLKSSTNINSFGLITNGWKKDTLNDSAFTNFTKSTERQSDWSKDTQLAGKRVKIWTQAVWCAESTLQTLWCISH